MRIGFRLNLEEGRIERPGQEKCPQQKTHREHVEDPLDNDRADRITLADVLLLGEVERLDQLSQSAGENEGHRKTDGISGKGIKKFDSALFGPEQVFPAETSCGQVDGGHENDENNEGDVDLGEIAEDRLPIDFAEEKIEENKRQKEDGGHPNPTFLHFEPSILSSAWRGVNATRTPFLVPRAP